MKINSLSVKGGFGYLNFSLKFYKGLSFLVGINGSGKTTAIRLIEALLTPSLEQLDRIPHQSAILRLDLNGKEIRIESSVRNGRTQIKIPHLGQHGILQYDAPDFAAAMTREGVAKDSISSVYAAIATRESSNPVLVFLGKTIDTPLFLGLERRNVAMHFWQAEMAGNMSGIAARRRDMIVESVRRRMPSMTGMLGSSLMDVQIVIQEIFRKRRVEQEKFAAQLREQILLDAFEYQPSASFMRSVRQDARFIKTIIEKRSHVESALRGAGLADIKFKPLVDKFFDHISALGQRDSSLSNDRSAYLNDGLLELALNKPVVDRVLKLIEASERYNRDIEKLWGPITQFTTLVNRFLFDSGKELSIDEVGWLYVNIADDTPKTLDILSSGERQLVVIFGHLAINREINRAGIFVVDEPEISLHLKWQEIFVNSILEASPGNQFILATHSPAIVVDRDNRCVYLDKATRLPGNVRA
ncbi:AAA family ATPase [Polaromonas sp. CT11-55]|uniref:AAA family ATPase n=1 Tax=Polaromonas sp. CT11-55 TaxID=3243045 RepID=UPI0039A74D9C